MSKQDTNRKPFTTRELAAAYVARDLLEKGSPASRIAKYCLEEKKMTAKQIQVFCNKLDVFITDEVMLAVWDLQDEKRRGDDYQKKGNILRRRLDVLRLERYNC